MWDSIKKLFKVNKQEMVKLPALDKEKAIMLEKLELLCYREGLVELLKNDTVGMYLLTTYEYDIANLIENEHCQNNVIRELSVREFFNGSEFRIYKILSALIRKLSQSRVGSRQRNDIKEIIEMFNICLGGI